MARTLGDAGGSARNEAIDKVVARLSPPEPETQYRVVSAAGERVLPGGCAWGIVFMFGGLSFLSFITYNFRWMVIWFGVSILAFIVLAVLQRSETRQVPIDPQEAFPEWAQEVATIRGMVERDFDKVVETRKVKGTLFEGDDKMWALGAAGEVRTSRMLAMGLDDTFSLFDDLMIQKNGANTANIDHLITTDRGGIMIDTKVWNQKLVFEQTPLGVIIPKDNFAGGAISTCLYEASFLPGTPRAIVFAVDGSSSRQIPNGLVRVDFYYDRFDTRGAAMRSPIPVFFAPQESVVAVVAALDRELPPGEPIRTESFTMGTPNS